MFGPTASLDVERLDALFAANVRAPYLLVAGFAPGMVGRGRGSIIGDLPICNPSEIIDSEGGAFARCAGL